MWSLYFFSPLTPLKQNRLMMKRRQQPHPPSVSSNTMSVCGRLPRCTACITDQNRYTNVTAVGSERRPWQTSQWNVLTLSIQMMPSGSTIAPLLFCFLSFPVVAAFLSSILDKYPLEITGNYFLFLLALLDEDGSTWHRDLYLNVYGWLIWPPPHTLK